MPVSYTHLVVEKVCNKVSVIKHGQLLYSGRTTEIVGTKGLEEVFMEDVYKRQAPLA